MRIVFALSGLHRVLRGAEVTIEALAQELAATGRDEVVLVGSGTKRPDRAYRFEHVPAISRDRFEAWPTMPFLHSSYAYEELTFAIAMLARPWRDFADVTVTCSYPYTHWVLRLQGRMGGVPHVFVTHCGDWPAYQPGLEGKLFWCDGLICINQLYYERNRDRWLSALIPNGVDSTRFHPGPGARDALGLPRDRQIVLMVCALVDGKMVLEGIRATARVQDSFLLLAGDGPLRDKADRLAGELLPGRFVRRTFPHEQMPEVYRSADVLLQPGFPESFGNVYIEALASGLPVVANDNPSTRWILGDHAFLTDTTSSVALQDAIRRALSSPAASAPQRAAYASHRFAWPAIAEQYRDFLARVVQRSR